MMNINNSRSKVTAMTKGLMAFCLLGSLSFMTGCSDKWDEHYGVAETAGSATIWETISSDGQLSNFSKVVKACGYDLPLASSQVFTVFASTNSCFTSEQADSVINLYNVQKAAGMKESDNAAVKEFLRNYISLYNYSVSSLSNDSITMMNGKYFILSSDAIGGVPFVSSNKLLSNGVLFTLKDRVSYVSNVFEYLHADADLDSVATFLYSYNKYEFDASQSVPGGIEDGKTVYLDSVKYLRNPLFNALGPVNSEDSTYWMVVPTNDAWKQLVEEYRDYFNFDDTYPDRDSLAELYTKMSVLRGTVFSRTTNTDQSIQDSAMSTNAVRYESRKYAYGSSDLKYYVYDKPYAPGGVFDGTENIACSNGQVMKASDWHIDKRQTFFQTMIVEAETASNLKEVDANSTRDLSIVAVQPSNPFYNKISGNSYVEIIPTGVTNPSVTFYIRSVLSNIGYDIYAVTAPAIAGDSLARESDRMPFRFTCALGWNAQSGKYVTENVGGGPFGTTFETRQDVADTILIASDYRFPTCSYGATAPQVTFTIKCYRPDQKQFQRTMRLDCIIFKPHEEPQNSDSNE